MDEVFPVAKAVGVEKEYKEMVEAGKTDYEDIKKYLKLLYGKPESWIAKQINKAEPYEGSKETITYLKKAGYNTFIVTDDPLASLPECNKTIAGKLGGEIKIIPTAEIEYSGGKICGGLKDIKTKPRIMQELLGKCGKSPEIICMVQGHNDIEMAKYARKITGTVISVNSHSQELENASNHHIDSIGEAPSLLEKILAAGNNLAALNYRSARIR